MFCYIKFSIYRKFDVTFIQRYSIVQNLVAAYVYLIAVGAFDFVDNILELQLKFVFVIFFFILFGSIGFSFYDYIKYFTFFIFA